MSTIENISPNKSSQLNSKSFSRVIGIRGRLLIGFSAITLIMLFSVIFALTIVTSSKNIEDKVIHTDLPSYNAFLELETNIFQLTSALRGWMLTHNPRFKTERLTSISALDKLQLKIDNLSRQWTNYELIKNWQEIKSLLMQFKAAQTKVENITNPQDAVKELMSGPVVTYSKILDILNGSADANGKRLGGVLDVQYLQLQNGTKKISNQMNLIQNVEFILLIIILIAAITISLVTARKILLPLNRAINIAEEIAAGRRDVNIAITSKDETGTLLTALNTMQNSIKADEEKLRQSKGQSQEMFENIVKTAKLFSTHSSKIAAGDLRQRLEITSEDIMAQLGHDLNTMTENLTTITKQITQSSHNMVTTLQEVTQAANEQSTGATEQASSINEITASLEEIEKSSAQTMEKAKTLGEIAQRSREKGELGLEAVEQSMQGMKEVRDKVQLIAQTILDLSNQTQQIGEITTVVNTLAQQSKMLALNASIEAAKAGDKGFAVVAAEVRNLAEQSEQSTTQVQKILEDIRHATEKAVMVTEEGIKGVDHGNGLVEQTGDIVRSLNDVINETSIASQQISAAVHQEAIGIAQITTGMNEINQVTSSFVASANQTITAINSLTSISKNLKDYVDTYKT